MSLFYAAYYAGSGLNQPYFPVWLAAHGLDRRAIGVTLAIPMVLRIITIRRVGRWSDRFADQRPFMAAISLVVLACGVGLAFSDSVWTIIPLTAVMIATWQSSSPLADALALNLVRAGRAHFGRMRVWGSLSFVTASAIGGILLQRQGVGLVFALFLLTMVIQAATTWMLPVKRHSGAQAPNAIDPSDRPRGFVIVLAGAALVQASHAGFNVFGMLYLLHLGYASSAVGLLWGVSTLAEIASLFFGASLFGRIDPVKLIALAGAVATLRWGGMAIGPGAFLLVVLQALHAVTFAGSYLGVMRYITVGIGAARAATAQSSYNALYGTIMAAATSLAGLLFAISSATAFVLMAAIALCGSAAALTVTGLSLGRSVPPAAP